MPDAKRSSGSIALNAQEVKISPNGRAVVGLEISGTWVANLDVKAVIDGTEQDATIVTKAGIDVVLPLTVNQIAFVNAVGVEQIIVRANGFTSGPAVVVLNATDGPLPQAVGGAAVTNANLDAPLSTLATQTTLAAVLAKIIAAPATEATLASILAKLIAAPATEATLALIKTDVDKIPPLTGPYPCTGFAPAAPTCTFTRPANTTAYTAGDEVGTAGTAPTTVSVARVNGGSVIIQGAQGIYSNYPATVPQLVLFLFNATVTLAGDNAQFALSDADAKKIVAVIPLSSTQALNYTAGAPTAAGALFLAGSPSRQAPHAVCGGSEVTLYACLITLNAFTPIANSEVIDITVDAEQN